MNEKQEGQKVRFDADKVIVLGPSFDFWLNEEDDVYDELYAEYEADAGTSVSDGRELSRRDGDDKS